MTDEMEELYRSELWARLDFLNLEIGMRHCLNDQNFYLDMLSSFVEDNQLESLKTLYLENKWQKYRIKIHTLMTSAEYIGADELAGWAREIDTAIHNGDEETVTTNHYHFITHYEDVLHNIDSVLSMRGEAHSAKMKLQKMIIVDFDEATIELLNKVLGERFEIVAVDDGYGLFNHLMGGVYPDIILMDMTSDVNEKLEVIKDMHRSKNYDNIPMAVLVEDENSEVLLEALSSGAQEYIMKPLKPEILIMRISHILRLARLQTNLQHEVYMRTKEDKAKNHRISTVLNQITAAFSHCVDAKENSTAGHTKRVARYVELISRKLKFSEEQISIYRYAALMHDIGIICVSDEIINKPGPLTTEEYAQLKQHTVKGAEVLSGITAIPPVCEGARWHHERYDGYGYPDGKIGIEIPEVARIIAVADAYDAMTSRRAYRDAYSQEHVRREIENGIETQFDPVFARVMLSIIDEDKNYELRE